MPLIMNMMIRHTQILLLIFLYAFINARTVSAQEVNLDSLYAVWQDQSQPDSTRVKAYVDYIWDGFIYSNPDSAEILTENLFRFSKKNNYPKAAAEGFDILGYINVHRSNYPLALENQRQSLNIYEGMGNKLGVSDALFSIGSVYYRLENYPRALDYYERSLNIYEEIGDIYGLAKNQNALGLIYLDQGNFSLALQHFEQYLKIAEELGIKSGIGIGLMHIGLIYESQGNYSLALEHFEKSLIIAEELGIKYGIAVGLSNIGDIYEVQGKFSLALEYYQKALKITEELGDKMRIALNLCNIGTLYADQGNYSLAVEFCKKSLALAEEIKVLSQKKYACKCLYDTYKNLGNGNEALVYLERIQVINDSLTTEETAKKLQQMEFRKEMFADSIAKAEIARLIEYAHQEEIRQKNQTRNWTIAGGVLALLLAGGFYSRWSYVRKSRNIIAKERDRSDNLLLNILPADIAAELKEKGKADARDFDLVSILFTDFKGFTAASEKLSAQDLVSEINTCFEAFDGIMTKYGIEKIKTIGDAYMAAGGLPVPSDDSMKKTVLAALEIQAFITNRKAKMEAQNKPAFEMRVGIHTGSVVAGIVGVKKFQYDIWGDTVNTASRMESNGEVGKVNISQATYNLLKDDPDFSFESRGKIEAKGKGEIEMYFVLAKNN